jgi:transcription elongation GreA/GreB family factor
MTAMSRAFVKESDGVEDLPDRLISPHANLVTPQGLQQIEAEVGRLSRLYAEAQASADRDALAAAARDLRYWTARRANAEVVAPPHEPHEVAFGVTVTLARSDGKAQAYRIVGEDEADPAKGLLSWVSPLARQLSGKSVGDEVQAGAFTYEIRAIA